MAAKFIFFSVFVTAGFLLPKISLATEFTSDNFKIIDPVIDFGGAVNSSSDNFKLTGAIGQVAIGTSSNDTFQLKSGWLFFSAAVPASAPAIAAAGSNFSMYLESLVQLVVIPLLPPTVFKPCDIVFDLNCDGSVGLKDFSIFLAVQNRPAPNPADFNKDNKIDFKDLSILLSKWTGKLLSFVEPAPSVSLTRTVNPSPFRGEAAIFPLRGISQSETVFKQPTQKPAMEKSGFFKTAIQFISNIFIGIKNLFKK